MAESPTHFRCRTTRTDDVVVIAAGGEIDAASAPLAQEELLRRLHPVPGSVVVDFGDVTFCSAAGIHLLLLARARTAALGIRLAVVAREPVLRILRVTVRDLLPLTHPTLSDARRALLSPSGGRPRDVSAQGWPSVGTR